MIGPDAQMGEEALSGGGLAVRCADVPGEAFPAGAGGVCDEPPRGGGGAPPPHRDTVPHDRQLAPLAGGGFALRVPMEGGRGFSGAVAAASPRGYWTGGPGSDAESLCDVPGTQV